MNMRIFIRRKCIDVITVSEEIYMLSLSRKHGMIRRFKNISIVLDIVTL